MTLSFNDLVKDLDKVDITDILSCWNWKLADMKAVVLLSCLGDLFLQGQDDAIYWLQTDCGNLTKVAVSLQEFQQKLANEQNIDNWFLPSLIQTIHKARKILKENEVYSYKVLPVIGGKYTVENIEPVDISVHFAFTGQIAEQIKDLPDGTAVNIKVQLNNSQ